MQCHAPHVTSAPPHRGSAQQVLAFPWHSSGLGFGPIVRHRISIILPRCAQGCHAPVPVQILYRPTRCRYRFRCSPSPKPPNRAVSNGASAVERRITLIIIDVWRSATVVTKQAHRHRIFRSPWHRIFRFQGQDSAVLIAFCSDVAAFYRWEGGASGIGILPDGGRSICCRLALVTGRLAAAVLPPPVSFEPFELCAWACEVLLLTTGASCP